MKILEFILKHQKRILLVSIALYIGVFSAICLWKYSIFGYNALDLAIFNNVFWHSAEGQLFQQSIHQNSYLGDHAGFGLLALLPLYMIYRGPQILLILQTIALATAAWPIYLLAKNRLKKWELAPLVVSLAWLLNPLVHNINLYEFHLLPFALVPLFFMLLAYERSKLGLFFLFATIAALFREDVSFVIAAVGVLAALEKRGYWWRILPILFGGAWFLGATSVISMFAPGGSYKYALYYSWLGESTSEILPHVFSVSNLEMLIGFGLSLLFLPYVAPKRLVLAAGPLFQIIFSSPGGSIAVLHTHYATLFLPGIFLAAIAGIEYLSERVTSVKRRKKIFHSPFMLLLILAASIYGAATVGPVPSAVARIISGTDKANAEEALQIIEAVQETEAIVASYSLLPHLSSRENIFAAHYVFLGVDQFAINPYKLPSRIPIFLAFDSRDIITYRAQFKNSAWAADYYDGGRERLANLAASKRTRAGQFTLYSPTPSVFGLGSVINHEPLPMLPPKTYDDGTTITDYGKEIVDGHTCLQIKMILGNEPVEAKRIIITTAENRYVRALVGDLTQPAKGKAPYDFSTCLPTVERIESIELDSIHGSHVLDGIRSNNICIEELSAHGQKSF